MNNELTTQQAADMLNVSCPYLIDLMEAGEVEYRTIGTSRMISTPSLLAYKRQDDARRRRAADELTQISQEMGMYTDGGKIR